MLFNTIHIPSLNATLNGICALFLLIGFICIKKKNILAHRISMSLAFMTSVLFLGFYLYYHYHFGSTKFAGQGIIRTIYFTILISHTILATLIVPFILKTIYHAIRNDFLKHAQLARWVWPFWMYVSVTGVVIYWMLYQIDLR
ncbi:MAG: DUF420 domain-containing protein [Elusimicrobiota bacterium]